LALTGCGKTSVRQPLNPPQLVGDQETEMAVQLFMQATVLLGRYYGYNNLEYNEVRTRSERAGFSTLPFMPPETIPATPSFKRKTLKAWNPTADTDRDDKIKAYHAWMNKYVGYNTLVKYYITTGLRASQVICRNYLSGLEERNRYVQFLQDQYGVFDNVAGLVLGATNANGTLRNAFSIANVGVNGALDKYREYRFLSVDYEEARLLVESAQDQLADYYYRKVDGVVPTDVDSRQTYARLFTFSDALNAVSIIESQCSRAGIRRLISKAVYATPTNMTVDPVTGTIIYRSNTDAGNAATVVNNTAPKKDGTNKTGQKNSSPVVQGVANPPPTASEGEADAAPGPGG